MPRSALRPAAVTRLGSNDGRMASKSLEIGLARVSSGLPPPNSKARAEGRNAQVTVSTMPRAAKARRTQPLRRCCAVNTGRVTAGRGMGVSGMAP